MIKKRNIPHEISGGFIHTVCPVGHISVTGEEVLHLSVDPETGHGECHSYDCKKLFDFAELKKYWQSDTRRADVVLVEGVPPQKINLPIQKGKSRVIIESFTDIEPEPIEWLWPGRIALGKLTLIAGDTGLGKSLLTTALAASVSKGYPWPVDGTNAPTGDVILLSAEDDAADTIRPRLDGARADCARVHIVKAVFDEDGSERIFSLKRDILALEKALESLPDCRMIVIDPTAAYLDNIDDHKNSDVRGVLAPLAELARRYRIAIILVHHLNKNTGGNALYRNIGSIAFTAAVRAAYLVAMDKDNPARRLLLPTKNNLAKASAGLAYSIVENEQKQPVIAWEKEPVTITADEALTQWDSHESEADTDWAVEVVRDILFDGPVNSNELIKQAKQAGLTDKQIRKARTKIGVIAKKTAFKGIWKCELPKGAQEAWSGSEGSLGSFVDEKGHLGNGTDATAAF